MPSITVDRGGTALYYQDSGAPPGVLEEYTTVVFIHGANFHSGVFQRLVPLAAQHGLRLVLLNRRDYPGSTPYSDEELKTIWDSDQGKHAIFVQTRGLEVLRFLEMFVKENMIPKVSKDGKKGGIAILGWSAGNATLCATLANASELEEEARTRLEEYMRAAIVYDPPGFAVGILQPFRGTGRTREGAPRDEGEDNFNVVVSSYFAHDLSRGKEGLSMVPDATRVSTFRTMSAREVESVVTPGVLFRSEVNWNLVDNSIWEANMKKGLLDVDAFSKMSVLVL